MPSQATQAQQATEIHGAATLAAADRADCAGQLESAQSAAQQSARSMPITQSTQAPADHADFYTKWHIYADYHTKMSANMSATHFQVA